jgi:hypothetical protein
VVATLLSAGSTAIPIAVTGALWATGEGTDEGKVFDLGMALLGLGAILGPSTGQIYAEGGSDAWWTFVFRLFTGSVALGGIGLWQRGEKAGIRNAGRALTIIGGSVTTILAIYDIWGASSSAVQAQRKRGYGPGFSEALELERRKLACQAVSCPPVPMPSSVLIAQHPTADRLRMPTLGQTALRPPAAALRLLPSPAVAQAW